MEFVSERILTKTVLCGKTYVIALNEDVLTETPPSLSELLKHECNKNMLLVDGPNLIGLREYRATMAEENLIGC